MSTTQQRIEAEILSQTAARGVEKSICPTEVARAISPDWRSHLSEVRAEAMRLAQAGRIEILRKGKPIAPEEMRGVIRLRTKANG